MKFSTPELDHGDNMARRRWTKEEKLQIVLTGLKDGVSVADLCRRHGISQTLYCQWKKKFLEAGALVLEGKAPTREEALKRENAELKEVGVAYADT